LFHLAQNRAKSVVRAVHPRSLIAHEERDGFVGHHRGAVAVEIEFLVERIEGTRSAGVMDVVIIRLGRSDRQKHGHGGRKRPAEAPRAGHLAVPPSVGDKVLAMRVRNSLTCIFRVWSFTERPLPESSISSRVAERVVTGSALLSDATENSP